MGISAAHIDAGLRPFAMKMLEVTNCKLGNAASSLPFAIQ
jgi:hypothetical protein